MNKDDDKVYFSVAFQYKTTKYMHAKIIELLEKGEIEFAPAYTKDKDGHIKILEISAVRKQNDSRS